MKGGLPRPNYLIFARFDFVFLIQSLWSWIIKATWFGTSSFLFSGYGSGADIKGVWPTASDVLSDGVLGFGYYLDFIKFWFKEWLG